MEPKANPDRALMIEENVPQTMLIDPKRDRFPCCIVWSPLPVLSWFIPFIGHIGICREDGVILDFVGPNFVCVDNFTFGVPTRYFQLSKEQCCCISHYSAEHSSEDVQNPDELGSNVDTWDAALRKSTQEYQHQAYNLLTCNCHSFVANVLNRLGFQAGRWNVVSVAIFIFLKGQWVNKTAIVKTYLPSLVVLALGLIFGGGTFLTYLAIFMFIIIGWFLLGTYCFKKLIHV